MTEGVEQRRGRQLGWLLIAAFSILTVRLWQLQMLHGQHYAELAQGNFLRRLPVEAPRGKIYDRNGQLLAGDRYAYTVSVMPGLFDTHDTDQLHWLSSLLGLSTQQIVQVVRSGAGQPYVPVRLDQDVDPRVVIEVEEHRYEHPGVLIDREPVRTYPQADLLGNVIGYIGAISGDDLASHPEYRPTDQIGQTGLERAYESLLRGKSGSLDVEVDASGRRVGVLDDVAPMPGADLHLTIDSRLQRAAQDALSRQVQKLRKSGAAPDVAGGAVVVLNPHNGEILALATEPNVDPSRMVGPGRSAYYASISGPDAHDPQVNRALRAYMPGSTFKVVTALAALQSGAITPKSTYNATGYGPYPNEKDWTLNHTPPLPAAGVVTVAGALAQSSDDYFWHVADPRSGGTGEGPIVKWARALGLGQPTGLKIPEQAGVVPDAAWMQRTKGHPWWPGDTMNIAIGEGDMKATPLQMADVYEAIVNDGIIYRPTLISSITGPDGSIALKPSPEIIYQASAPKASWQVIRQGLQQTISYWRGTAHGAFLNFPIPVMGKTGSAEVTGSADAWFAGMAPAYDPQIVVVVYVEHGASGGGGAAPVAREVFDAYFNEG